MTEQKQARARATKLVDDWMGDPPLLAHRFMMSQDRRVVIDRIAAALEEVQAEAYEKGACFGINKAVAEYKRGVAEARVKALQEAAAKCEALVTFAVEHEKYCPKDASVPCGWCDGLEKAASEIRALASAPAAEEKSQ